MKRAAVAMLLAGLVTASAGAAASQSTYYSEPEWSPDGKRIAFVGTVSDSSPSDLFVINANGTGTRQLTHGSYASGDYGARNPAWSADAKRIAFAYGYYGICVINADGSGFKRLTSTGDQPAWSPRGRRIAFADGGELAGESIYAMRADGTGKELVAAPTGWRSFGTPSWSPDGQRLVFSVGTAPDPDYIHAGYLGMVDQYRGRIRVFLRGRDPGWSDWSRSGRKVVVNYDPAPTRSSSDPSSIGVLDVRTRRFHEVYGYGFHPTWAPNGRRITLSADGDIWVMKANGTGVRRLTHAH